MQTFYKLRFIITSFFCFYIFYVKGQDSTRANDFSRIPNYPSENKKRYLGFRIYHENDFIIPAFISRNFFKNTDDNYTGGLKIEIITNIPDAKNSFVLNPLRGNINSVSFVFGVTAFTPQDLANTAIVFNDRPYASFRFWGLGVSSVSPDTSWNLSYELQFGAMGKPLAGDAQSYLHRKNFLGSKRPDPKGWDYQIGYDGAFAFNLHGKLERKIWSSKLQGRKQNFRWVQVSTRGELNVGQYMTNISVEPRISLLNWNHNPEESEDEPGLPSIARPLVSGKTKNTAGFYLFFGLRPRFVLHNTTLTGRLLSKSSVHTIAPSELKRALFEYDFGFAFRWYFLRLGYNLFGRSKEFSFQNKNFHNWGGFYVGGIFRFH